MASRHLTLYESDLLQKSNVSPLILFQEDSDMLVLTASTHQG